MTRFTRWAIRALAHVANVAQKRFYAAASRIGGHNKNPNEIRYLRAYDVFLPIMALFGRRPTNGVVGGRDMNNGEKWAEKVLRFGCPLCDALPGQPCVTARLKPRLPHKGREEIATMRRDRPVGRQEP